MHAVGPATAAVLKPSGWNRPYATVRAALDSLKPSGLFELTLVQQRELEVASNLLMMMMRWQEQVTKYQLKVGLPMAHAPAA